MHIFRGPFDAGVPRQATSASVADRRAARVSERSSDAARLPDVAGIICEMANVLYDSTLWRRWLLRLLSRFGISTSYQDFYSVWERDYLVDVHCGRREFAEAFQAFLRASGLSWAQIDEVEAASRLYHPELEADVRPLPGVAATLSQLHSDRLRLGVLSNSPQPAVQLEQKLQALGLAGYFEFVLSSLDLEAAKPAAECYAAATAALGLPNSEVVYVGFDSAGLRGAREAGLRTIAINYESGAAADAYVVRFPEVLDLVPQWPCPPDRACETDSAASDRQ